MTRRRRLDAELVRRELSARWECGELIISGRVTVGGAPAPSLSAGRPRRPIGVAGEGPRFVVAAVKLDAALDQFAIDVAGLRVIDTGSSTGGFTDCVLQRCRRSSPLMLAETSCTSGSGPPRVTVHERTNIRHADPGRSVAPGRSSSLSLHLRSYGRQSSGRLLRRRRSSSWSSHSSKPASTSDRGRGVIETLPSGRERWTRRPMRCRAPGNHPGDHGFADHGWRRQRRVSRPRSPWSREMALETWHAARDVVVAEAEVR